MPLKIVPGVNGIHIRQLNGANRMADPNEYSPYTGCVKLTPMTIVENLFGCCWGKQ